MIINTDNYAAAGIKAIVFPGGEVHIELPKIQSPNCHIFAHIRSANDWMMLLALLDALQRVGVHRNLFMPYLPAARQDRYQDNFAFTSALYAQMLGLRCDTLVCVDPHSLDARKVYGLFLKGDIHTIPLGSFIPHLIETKYDIVLAPDEGAVMRAREVADVLGVKEVLYCKKKRNSQTGELEEFEVPDLSGYSKDVEVLIADDICDGGGTFVGIREQLPENANVDLYVTHGIFSKGLGPLKGFRQIYTTNSFCRADIARRLVVEDLTPYYFQSLNV